MAEPFSFPESKLTPPAPRRRVVDRPRLVQALRDGSARRLVVVTAEAGYGKTYLLVAALAAAGRPVAWLTLDESDTDPNLFAAGIVLSLRRIAPGVGQGALDVLTTGPSDDVLAATVRRTFEELPAETVLVLDDFHVLDATPAAHALVDRWLTDAPARLRLVVASRTRPPLRALPRLLVEGEGLVLDRAALAFRPDEARALLAGSFGLLVSEEQARELAERTEGWAAALSLVAQAAQGGGLPALEGTPREIFDYLATAVVDGLPDELQAFAMHTSVLFVLTPDICAALTGTDARGCLDALEARSLFLTRLDADGPRYRYHQLFSEFLQQRLAGRQPALVAELHRRAGAHLERQGRGDEAVRHFLLAGAYPDAVRVLVPYRGGRLTARRAYVFRDLVRRLPRAVGDAHPWLLRTAASSCRFIGDYEQALTWSRQAMAAAEGRDVDLWADAVHGVGVMLRSLGRLGEAVTTLEAAVEQRPAGVNPGLVALLHQALAFAYCVRGDLDESARATDEALRLAVTPDDVDARSSALLNRGQLALIRLEPSAARAVFRSVREYAEEHRSGYYQVWAWAGLAAADIALGEVAGAAEALGRAQTLQAQVGERALELQLAWTEGDLALRRGELDAAEQHYERALAQWRDGELARARVLALLGLARVDLARPRVSRALDRAREAAAIATRGEIGSLLPLARLIEAEALGAAGDADGALARLDEATAAFGAWRSGPGEARCALVKARLLGGKAPAALLPRAAALTVRHRDELIGWLREEARWVAPLLAPALGREGVASLLVDLGEMAVGALIEAIGDRQTRLAAIHALARTGDVRARRPLQRWSRRGEAAVRAAAAAALGAIGEPEPPPLRVRLFGRFDVLRAGRPVDDAEWTTQKARALVKLLLLHRPGGLHDEQLVEWLWPDHDAERGRASLKTAVKLARRALEPWLEGGASHFLRREGRALRFADAGVWVDLDEHAHLTALARSHSAAGRIDEAVAALGEATALYRGDLLDPEDRYETWAEPARERWRQAQREALVELSHLLAARGDYEPATVSMRAVIALDPLHEGAYRDLIRYALLRGRRDEALATYQECARALERGLGASPEPATRRLLEDVRPRA